jgi:hypothetical protein
MTFGVLPGTRPSRPAYPPPVPVGFVDPGGHTPVEKALRTQQAVADQYTAWRAAHSPNIDPDVLKDNAGAFQVSDAALALAPALNAVKADADAATSKVNDLISDTRVETMSRARLPHNAGGRERSGHWTVSKTPQKWLRQRGIWLLTPTTRLCR